MKRITASVAALLVTGLSACGPVQPEPANKPESAMRDGNPSTLPSPVPSATTQAATLPAGQSPRPRTRPTTGMSATTRRARAISDELMLPGVIRQWHMRAAAMDEKLDSAMAQSFDPEVAFVANLNIPGAPLIKRDDPQELARAHGYGMNLPRQVEPGDRFFGLATVKVEKAGPAVLTIGSDLRQVYINGKQVWADPTPAAHDRKQTLTVNLEQGPCRIAIETGKEFFLSLTDPTTGADATLRSPTWPATTADTRNDGNGIDSPWWLDRFQEFSSITASGKAQVIFVGDSITQGWAGYGRETWSAEFAPMGAVNYGIGGEEAQHALWRLRNGELDGATPSLGVILLGSNNIAAHADHSPEEVAHGVALCVAEFQKRTPNAKVLVLGVLPREAGIVPELMPRITQTNQFLSKLADGKQVYYLDIGKAFLDADGHVNQELMPDRVHPNAQGYVVFAREIAPTIHKLLGKE